MLTNILESKRLAKDRMGQLLSQLCCYSTNQF